MRALGLFVVAMTALGGIAPAHAQNMDLMEFADADHDGKVTAEEYAAFCSHAWEYFAQGADKVKPTELPVLAKPLFSGVAPDASGFVAKDAYLAAVPAHFKAADKNGDGTLDASELRGSMAAAG